MTQFDLPLSTLREYAPQLHEPADFDSFWQRTLAETAAAPIDVVVQPIATPYALIDSFDVSFGGFGGDRIKAWLHLPRGAAGPLPAVVTYAGYSGGRGLAHQFVEYALSGYAQLTMDTRGQGYGGISGHTPDPHVEAGDNQAAGFMTRGVMDPERYYYRRVFIDGVRAVEAVKSLPQVDDTRVAVAGVSQGGGIAIAVAALTPGLSAALVDVPFLCHYERALTLTDNDPYQEIVRYLKRNRDHEQQVRETLSYFDGAILAKRATAPTLFSTALMDATCPPSTVFAAFNSWQGKHKEIVVYPFNQHEGGQEFQDLERFAFLSRIWPAA